MSGSSSTSTTNIPTFIAEMPPSPRKQRQAAKSSETKPPKVSTPGGIGKPGTPAPIPSMILQESAEDERRMVSQTAAAAAAMNINPLAALVNQNLTSVTNALGGSMAATLAAAASNPGTPVYVQVMLQLPGSPLIPVNIPAEVILPSLTSMVAASIAGSTATVSTGMVTATPTTPVARPPQPSLTVGQTMSPSILPPASFRLAPPRLPIVEAPQPAVRPPAISRPRPPIMVPTQPAKIPRLTLGGAAPVVMASLATNCPTTTSSGGGFGTNGVGNTGGGNPGVGNTGVGNTGGSVIRQQSAPEMYRSQSSVRSDSDDLEEDSKKNLQQNKNAATRCRQKKKQQVENMEKKAKDLQAQNKTLEDEMSQLKQDICDLENLLKEHEDCFASTGPGNYYYTLTENVQ